MGCIGTSARKSRALSEKWPKHCILLYLPRQVAALEFLQFGRPHNLGKWVKTPTSRLKQIRIATLRQRSANTMPQLQIQNDDF